MTLQKELRYQSQVLRRAAKNRSCVLCGNEQTTVLGHLPGAYYGMPAGTGQKTHDWLGAHLCVHCHEKMDTIWRKDTEIRMRALCKTLQRLFDEGTIRPNREAL